MFSPLLFVQMARTVVVVVVGAFLGFVGERLLSNNPSFHEKVYICGEQFLLAEKFAHTHNMSYRRCIYTHLLRHLDGENYLPLLTQAAELDLFFLLLFFFFVPSLLVPFDFPLSSAAARLT